MRKSFFLLVFLTQIMSYSFAQNEKDAYIEVIGYAEKEISPDYIIISFELSEYNPETKQTTPLIDQENKIFRSYPFCETK